MNYKKPAFWVTIVTLVCVAAVCIGFATNKIDNKKEEQTPLSLSLYADQSVGVQMTSLDYASDEIVIFHDYYGLFVYDFNAHGISRFLDLEPIGCQYTQGDQYCEVQVSLDGNTVQLHPANSKTMFVYDVISKSINETAYANMDIKFSTVPIETAIPELTDVGNYSFRAVQFPNDYGYITTTDQTLATLSYVRGDKTYLLFSGLPKTPDGIEIKAIDSANSATVPDLLDKAFPEAQKITVIGELDITGLISKNTAYLMKTTEENSCEVVFPVEGYSYYIGVTFVCESENSGWALLPVNAVNSYDSARWNQIDTTKTTITLPDTHSYEMRASLHDGMPEYRFVATGYQTDMDEWGTGFVLGLEGYDENGKSILSADFSRVQDGTVVGSYVYNQMMDTMGLHIVDVNFDGYKDVIILSSFGGAHSNTWYYCWLWDAKTSSFVVSESFGEICNPALDSEKKCIYSTGGSGASYWGGSIYKFIDGEFVVANDLNTGENGLVESELVNGNMEVVREATYHDNEKALNEELAYYKKSELWQLDHPHWYWYGGHHADQWLD